MKAFASWLVKNLTDVIAAAALLAMSAGFAMAWPPLGLIVPGVVVFGLIAWSRIGHETEPPAAPEKLGGADGIP